MGAKKSSDRMIGKAISFVLSFLVSGVGIVKALGILDLLRESKVLSAVCTKVAKGAVASKEALAKTLEAVAEGVSKAETIAARATGIQVTQSRKAIDVGLAKMEIATTQEALEAAKIDMLVDVVDVVEGEMVSASRLVSQLSVPQGLSQELFSMVSSRIKSAVASISDDITVQGSRASGIARLDSDIDFAIRVPESKFNELISSRFGVPNPGSAKERTMLHAIETGKIQAGEAGLSSLRKELQQLLGMDVDISIIKQGGAFDNGQFIKLT
jgi:predicted nucleotidyltransferase